MKTEIGKTFSASAKYFAAETTDKHGRVTWMLVSHRGGDASVYVVRRLLSEAPREEKGGIDARRGMRADLSTGSLPPDEVMHFWAAQAPAEWEKFLSVQVPAMAAELRAATSGQWLYAGVEVSGQKLSEDTFFQADPARAAKISAAAAALGRIKSPAKAAASRENGKKGGRPPLTLVRLCEVQLAGGAYYSQLWRKGVKFSHVAIRVIAGNRYGSSNHKWTTEKKARKAHEEFCEKHS